MQDRTALAGIWGLRLPEGDGYERKNPHTAMYTERVRVCTGMPFAGTAGIQPQIGSSPNLLIQNSREL